MMLVCFRPLFSVSDEKRDVTDALLLLPLTFFFMHKKGVVSFFCGITFTVGFTGSTTTTR